jgi:hypothetical protein
MLQAVSGIPQYVTDDGVTFIFKVRPDPWVENSFPGLSAFFTGPSMLLLSRR